MAVSAFVNVAVTVVAVSALAAACSVHLLFITCRAVSCYPGYLKVKCHGRSYIYGRIQTKNIFTGCSVVL